MKVIKLNTHYMEAFKEYCQVHRYEHDESYLYEEDMADFELDTGKLPTWILLDDHKIVGVLSLLLEAYFLKGGKSRVRIFHCVSGRAEDYQALFDAIENLPEVVKKIELFMPDKVTKVLAILKSMGFAYYRTAYVMVRKNKGPVNPNFPQGYTLRNFILGQDEDHYAQIRNRAFKDLKGSETPLTQEQIKDLTTGSELMTDGIQFLCFSDQPVGLVRMELESGPDGNFGFVAPIALLPEHQGKGLGTELLKAGIAISHKNNVPDTMLCVNAENDQALGLYKKVGFTIDESISCLHFLL